MANRFGTWRGFGAPRGAGLQSGMYALYPLGFWELMRTVLKVNVANFVLAIPLLLVLVAFLSGNFGLSIGITEWAGLKLVALGLMLQPALAIFCISPRTNDTQKPVVILAALVLILMLLGAGATFIFSNRPLEFLPAGIAVGILSTLVLVLYGRRFNRNGFDLVPVATAENSTLPHG
jgi:hypothetical protein